MGPANDQSPAPSQLYQTDLATTPLPEILVKIFRYRAPGILECRRGDVIKRVYVDRGQIVFATTNQLSESLGDKLLREGKITREQYDESIQRLRVTGKRHGVTLMEMKALDQNELAIAVRDQIQEIVWSIFEWPDGTVTFTPGREKHLEFVKIELSIPRAVMQGVRRMPDARALVARLGTKSTALMRTDQTVEDADLSPEERRLYQTVDGRTALYELVTTAPLSPGDNARVLYGLFALQLVAVRQASPVKVQVKTTSPGFTE